MPSAAASGSSRTRSICPIFSQVWQCNLPLDTLTFVNKYQNRKYIFFFFCLMSGNGKVNSSGVAEGSFTALTGLLEVEPLHFTCVSTSDGTRVERDDASMFTGRYPTFLFLSIISCFFYNQPFHGGLHKIFAGKKRSIVNSVILSTAHTDVTLRSSKKLSKFA